MTDTVENDGLGPCPTPGEIRVFDGQRCRFIERELEGDKWVVLGPAPMTDTVRVPRAWLEAFRRDTDPTEPIADDGGTVWDMFCHEASAMLAASPSVGGWEDISTAPKDNNEFLIAWADGGTTIGWWNALRSYVDWQDSLSPSAEQPTHWMPLPPPPSVSTDKGSRPQEAVPTEQADGAVVAPETWASMAKWTAETFGPVSLERIATRANEEMQELLADPSDVTEAADVCIVLSRYPGIEEAINRKMAINRGRQWKLNGDGSGYHIKPDGCSSNEGAGT